MEARNDHRKVEDILNDVKNRNKLIRMANKSPGGWTTVGEQQSDSIASNTDDERKMKAAERRTISRMKSKQQPNYSTSSMYKRAAVDQCETSGRPVLQGKTIKIRRHLPPMQKERSLEKRLPSQNPEQFFFIPFFHSSLLVKKCKERKRQFLMLSLIHI